MDLKNILFVLFSTLLVLESCKEYSPVKTFKEAPDPVPLSSKSQNEWKRCDDFNAGWGDVDYRYSRSEVPDRLMEGECSLTAWRGERISAQLLIWTKSGLDGVKCNIEDFISEDFTLPSSIAKSRFVRYTLSDSCWFEYNSSKKRTPILAADMLDSLSVFDIPSETVRPVWLTINVPFDALPGTYKSKIIIQHKGKGEILLPVELNVLNRTLPEPKDWKFHLDLWQHPSSVARAEGLLLWSDEHFNALKTNMSYLADAGQKVITTTLNKDPWNNQCYDNYNDMIKWTLHKDGKWSYDYTIFDRWVGLMMSLGINKMINCYSILPWNNELVYFDEKLNKVVTVIAKPGEEEFVKMWVPFLKDFRIHLGEKKWLNITNIAMDERSSDEMNASIKLIKEYAPELGISIADNHELYKRYSNLRDICIIQGSEIEHNDILRRRMKGYNTTFYVCCVPEFPNTFTFSNPYEAELLGWYCLAYDFDGMLRWAYNSWPENPEYDSRFGRFGSGDTFLVYPFGRSSVRMERLIDGIEVVEKVRVLRKQGIDITSLEQILNEIKSKNINDSNLMWNELLRKANIMLNSL